MRRTLVFTFLSVFTALACALAAAAYLDPSATAYMIQIISGVVITAGAVIAIFWKKIRLFFKKRKQAARIAKLSEAEAEQAAPDEKQL